MQQESKELFTWALMAYTSLTFLLVISLWPKNQKKRKIRKGETMDKPTNKKERGK